MEKLFNLDFNLVLVMEFWVVVLEWLGMLDVVINKVENVIVMVKLVSVILLRCNLKILFL